MKKTFLLLIFSFLLFSGCSKKQEVGNVAPTQRPKRVDTNVNAQPLEMRPFVELIPTSDGKSIKLSITEMKKKANDVEYEIEYSSGFLLQGAFGTIDKLSALPASKDILLGSCSSGGKCTYNKDVTGGTLTLRFGSPDFILKGEWSYTENAKKQTIFSSRDGKFSLDVAKAKNTASTVIIYNTPGFPGDLSGKKIVAGPYNVSMAGDITGGATVSMRVNSSVAKPVIMGWDGQTWSTLVTTVKDDQVTAPTAMKMTTFVTTE